MPSAFGQPKMRQGWLPFSGCSCGVKVFAGHRSGWAFGGLTVAPPSSAMMVAPVALKRVKSVSATIQLKNGKTSANW